MLRTPLDELVLQIGLLYEQRRDKAKGGDFVAGLNPIKFLSNVPSPPAEESLVQACKHLLEVEALKVVAHGDDAREQTGWLYRLTPLGVSLSIHIAASVVFLSLMVFLVM